MSEKYKFENPKVEYLIMSHLGNVRASADATGNVVQRDDYYPFGLTYGHWHTGLENKNKFNGVEENNLTQSYETAFRGYDGALGRFAQVDPLADLITGISPYHFGYNNPISYNDPLGLIGNNPYGNNPLAKEGYENMTMTPGERWSANQEVSNRQENGYYDVTQIISSIIRFISNYNYTPDDPSAGISTHYDYETVYTKTQRMYFYQSATNGGGYYEDPMFYINGGIGVARTGATIKGGYHLSNELYHYTRSSGNLHFRGGKYWNNPFVNNSKAAIAARGGAWRSAGTKLGYAGIAITTGDALMSGEFRTSQGINVAMNTLAIAVPGVGSIVAGVYFVADIGLTLSTGRGIGDRIDAATGGTHELYNGLY